MMAGLLASLAFSFLLVTRWGLAFPLMREQFQLGRRQWAPTDYRVEPLLTGRIGSLG